MPVIKGATMGGTAASQATGTNWLSSGFGAVQSLLQSSFGPAAFFGTLWLGINYFSKEKSGFRTILNAGIAGAVTFATMWAFPAMFAAGGATATVAGGIPSTSGGDITQVFGNYTPHEPTGRFAKLLKRIGWDESKLNPNATWGGGMPLINGEMMTENTLGNVARYSRNHPIFVNGGWTSRPMGAYQMMPGFIEETAGMLGLPMDSTLFDPLTQDNLASAKIGSFVRKAATTSAPNASLKGWLKSTWVALQNLSGSALNDFNSAVASITPTPALALDFAR